MRALRKGELDVALVSSIELFRRPGYRYLDGLAVSGEGSVASVQVFLKKPIEFVRTVALDPSSEAAATLVRVLFSGGTPERRFVEVASGESFGTFLARRIFEPLGMNDTDFWVPPTKRDRLCALYVGVDLLDPTRPGLLRAHVVRHAPGSGRRPAASAVPGRSSRDAGAAAGSARHACDSRRSPASR